MHSLLSHNHGCSHCSASSYPRSSGAFVSEAAGVLTQLATFLTGSGSPLIMVDSYPYFAYASDPAQISLEYALFNPKQPITTWPSAGNAPYASLENARAYNWNLWNHVVETGTPRKPDLRMDVFFLEMFNYNRKAIGVRAEFSIPLSKYASLFNPL
ncbi:putative glucan endo-1,3-beta-glucosidase BG4 [Vitis vinifera]|uniref:glucan endo-1,3-beta-D-glucosidase n=1 Tax=Vitis vinifera TaxID=29760 RepID=A0A438KN07_VITVI|nr:putative glucan endo-1,3-beta-glucosidase BG4 [Vitis vinifera]